MSRALFVLSLVVSCLHVEAARADGGTTASATVPDEAPDASGSAVEQTAPSSTAESVDADAERWKFRAMAAAAAPIGAMIGTGAFFAFRLVFLSVVYGAAAFVDQKTANAIAGVYQASFFSYVFLPVLGGLGAALFVWPFASRIGALATGAVTTGATAVLFGGGTVVGLVGGTLLGAFTGFGLASSAGDPWTSLGFVVAGSVIGGALGFLTGAVIGGLGGVVIAPAAMGALVGREPEWWAEAMGAPGE